MALLSHYLVPLQITPWWLLLLCSTNKQPQHLLPPQGILHYTTPSQFLHRYCTSQQVGLCHPNGLGHNHPPWNAWANYSQGTDCHLGGQLASPSWLQFLPCGLSGGSDHDRHCHCSQWRVLYAQNVHPTCNSFLAYREPSDYTWMPWISPGVRHRGRD